MNMIKKTMNGEAEKHSIIINIINKTVYFINKYINI